MASNLFQMRNVKIRSLEDTQYTPQYNRSRFSIASDDMSTDLSQSYLLLRLQLTSTDPMLPHTYTNAELISWIANNVMVSFGCDDQAYSPASLIRTARLISRKTGTVIEEILFANVLSQFLFQMTNDKETLASQNLLSGTGFEVGAGTGITQSFTGFVPNYSPDYANAPAQFTLRILLKEMFGCCNTSNFFLSETNGIDLVFEFEDKLNILKTTVVADTQRIDFAGNGTYLPILPNASPDGYAQRPDTMSANAYPDTVPPATIAPSIFTDIAGASTLLPASPDFATDAIINKPKDGLYFNSGHFQPITWLDNLGAVTSLTMADSDVTVAVANTMGFINEALIKIGLTWSSVSSTSQPKNKIIEVIASIVSVGAPGSSGGAVINFSTNFDPDTSSSIGGLYYPEEWNVSQFAPAPYLSSICLYTPDLANVVFTPFLNSIAPEELITTELINNTFIMTDTELNSLIPLGIVANNEDNSSYIPTGVSFDLAIQCINRTVGQLIIPDAVLYQGTQAQKLISSGLVNLPATGGGVSIKDIQPNPGTSETFIVKFSDLGSYNTSGYSALCYTTNALIPPSDTNGPPPGLPVIPLNVPSLDADFGTGYALFFSNSMSPGLLQAPQAGSATWTVPKFNPYNQNVTAGQVVIPSTLSYSIDRFEIVLVQQTKQPKVPMSMGCSTFKLEPATIQSDLFQWQYQFYCGEPNVYNCILLTPEYTPIQAPTLNHPTLQSKLCSVSRGVSRFRYAVNNVQDTNRDLQLTALDSKYPSSLYTDKLLDWFGNSQYSLRSPYGLREIAHTRDPIVAEPLKIYTAFTGGQMIGNGGMPFTVQINMWGDYITNKPISAGAIFFYKCCLRSWNE